MDEIYPTLERTQIVNPAFQTRASVQEASSHMITDPEEEEGNIYALLEQPSTSTSSEAVLEECADIEDLTRSSGVQVTVPPPDYLESLYECVLTPGEMLYFPDKWQHATLNLDPYNLFVSVFLDLQLLQRATERVK